jgi:hypothetical protein
MPNSLDFQRLIFKLINMQKFFRKISSGIVSVMVIVAIMVTLSPLALRMAFLPDIKSSSSHHVTVQIVASQPIECINCLVPKPSRQLVFSFVNKQWPGLFSFVECLALSGKAQTCAEGYNYFYNNDVHFNIPSITYRQPSSEHSSEG